jgi:hypothetical protein
MAVPTNGCHVDSRLARAKTSATLSGVSVAGRRDSHRAASLRPVTCTPAGPPPRMVSERAMTTMTDSTSTPKPQAADNRSEARVASNRAFRT